MDNNHIAEIIFAEHLQTEESHRNLKKLDTADQKADQK